MPVVVGFVPTDEGWAAVDKAVVECGLRKTRFIVVDSSKNKDRDHSQPAPDRGSISPDLTSLLTKSGIDHEIRSAVQGVEPADDLIAVAHEVSAEMIVVGLRRRSPVGKLILGSNAQR